MHVCHVFVYVIYVWCAVYVCMFARLYYAMLCQYVLYVCYVTYTRYASMCVCLCGAMYDTLRYACNLRMYVCIVCMYCMCVRYVVCAHVMLCVYVKLCATC